MELNKELLAKAKNAKTPEELIALANENGMEMTDETAKMYFGQLNPKMGEISDDELDNVAGGGCYAEDGYLLTTIGHKCKYFEKSLDGSGVNGTCCACKYWDSHIRSSFEIFGSPLRCLNENNRRRRR